MKKNKKGFTLVELLAVIVILVILIIIAVVIVKNHTLEAKKKTIIANSITYVKAVNTLIVDTKNSENPIIDSVLYVDDINELGVKISGTKPDGGVITIFDSAVKYACLEYEEYMVEFKNGEYTDAKEDKCIKSRKFAYTGAEQTFTADKKGVYFIELWGAQGGTYSTALGGKGAYTSGSIVLNQGDILYINVGGQGTPIYNGLQAGGFNGGGTSDGQNWGSRQWSSGGGATDIRLVSSTSLDTFESLKSRIMVAGGGGGSFYDGGDYPGGDAGALEGLYGSQWTNDGYCYGEGGTQTSGGRITNNCNRSGNYGNIVTGSFGIGGNCTGDCTGGGGGYYGGSRSGHVASAGGGSSFISGYDGCDAIDESSTSSNIIHTGQSIHYSNKEFISPIMKAGNEEMPTQNGTSTMTGNTGNGYAKITFIGEV